MDEVVCLGAWGVGVSQRVEGSGFWSCKGFRPIVVWGLGSLDSD